MTACTAGLKVRKPQALSNCQTARLPARFWLAVLWQQPANKTSIGATGRTIAVNETLENLNGTERLKFGTNDGTV